MVSVNPGGEPERDDTGLPPVDIEIPDDARDLDRDVQAYYRELRAQRRGQRRRRLAGPLARDGIVLPLLACCMVLALITGTLLTVFSATSDRNGPVLPGKTPGAAKGSASRAPHPSGSASSGPAKSAAPSSSASASASAAPSASRVAGASRPGITDRPDAATKAAPLPAISLTVYPDISPAVSEVSQIAIPLAMLSGTVLVLIPPHCGCKAGVRWLAGIAAREHAPAYLVATPASFGEARWLERDELGATVAADTSVAVDTGNVLQARYPPHGLTAILVGGPSVLAAPQQSVYLAQNITAGGNPAAIIQALVA
jgi:hypothetical protein